MSIYSVALNNLTWESSIMKKEKASPLLRSVRLQPHKQYQITQPICTKRNRNRMSQNENTIDY